MIDVLPEKPLRRKEELAGRTLPTFLIVGAAKAGTTSLYEYLAQHPAVFLPKYKEPHYFVNGYGFDLDAYLALFNGAAGKEARGEGSTSYLYCPESPAWIRDVLGPVKILILLRDPAERAFSLYSWMAMEGFEDAGTFEEALRREPARQTDEEFIRHNPEFYPDYWYYSSGLYSEQVKRYYDTFGRGQVKVWLFEDLVKTPARVCTETFEFLGVDPTFSPRLEVHNRSSMPWSVPLQYWLRTRASRYCPGALRAAAMRWNNKWGGTPQKPAAALATLRERYREDVARLQDLIDRDLSAWV